MENCLVRVWQKGRRNLHEFLVLYKWIWLCKVNLQWNYHITNDRWSKCAWSNCVLHIPFILSGSPMYAGYIHATHAWLKTGRLGLQRQEEPTIKISPLQITYPAQERLQAKLMGSTLFEQWCGFFYVPREPDKWDRTRCLWRFILIQED